MNSPQIVLAALSAVSIPVIFLLLIYTLDLYASRSFHLVMLCFAWGTGGGIGLAYLINTYMAFPLIREMRLDYLLLYVAFAPVVEEIVKSLPFLYIYRHPAFTYFVDGAIYGFAAGIGFSIAESFLYISWHPGMEIPLALSRAFSTCLMHGTATALVGTAVGLFRFRRRLIRRLVLGSGWIFAILIHALFNGVVLAVPDGGFLGASAAVGIGLAGFGLIVLFILRGLQNEQKWLVESLDQRMLDLVHADLTPQEQVWLAETLDQEGGVTPAEVRASQVYEILDDFLKPVVQQFPRKAELMERIVLQQAQIGIKRRVQEEVADADLQGRLEQEITQLQKDTKRLRREAGASAMAYLQCVFAEEGGSDIWRCLEGMVACAESCDLPPPSNG